MAIITETALESNKNIRINFDGGNLSSDGGLLLLKEFYHKLGVNSLLKITFAQMTVHHSESTRIMRTFCRCFIRLPVPTFRTITPIA